MAYVVGLTATDGCLLSGRRKISFKSMDHALVETYLRLLGRGNRVREHKTRAGNTAYFTEFGDARLYRWLLTVGLTPRKSLTLGAIDVPSEHLFPLLRGLLDGDGSIINKTGRADTTDRPDYRWEYLQTKFTSASRAHLEWIRNSVRAATGVDGYLAEARRRIPDPTRQPFYQLRYGKHASVVLLPLLYPTGAPCLERKREVWLSYRERHPVE